MPADGKPLRAPTELLRDAQFAVFDVLRRAQGEVLGAIGFDPPDLAYQVLAGGHHWRLLDYVGFGTEAPLLIVAAPIKRPCIRNLPPPASAVRYCISHGLHVYLIEWVPTQTGEHVSFDEIQPMRAPLASIKPLLDAVPTNDVSIIRYPREIGVALQHLGILVGRQAYASIWPDILTWLSAHR